MTASPCGRITSSRFSRRLGKSIGIAWVPVAKSEEGTRDRDLRSRRRDDPGQRHARSAFYDPDGERLRS